MLQWRSRVQGRLNPLLAFKNVTKTFNTITALSAINIAVDPGDVVGLMGDNGAGKFTPAIIIAGNFTCMTCCYLSTLYLYGKLKQRA